MARTWLSVTVELLGGRDEDPWPWPGRIFAVGPSHTFGDLAESINTAFARWDRSHLSQFTLADGRIVTDTESGAEWAAAAVGPLAAPLDMDSTTVARTVGLGAEFQFTFDLGDNWVHRCTVGERKIDPLDEMGIVPRTPLPYWGWGTIPDQYGRRWAEDDGEHRVPARPTQLHPMRAGSWPDVAETPALDMSDVRAAIAARDARRFLAAIAGRDIDDVLQQTAAGLAMALGGGSDQVGPVVASVINRLRLRGWDGDAILAEDLLARLRGEPLPGRVLPIDLDLLADMLQSDPGVSSGCYLDLTDGELHPEFAGDDDLPDEESADGDTTVDSGPDRWLYLPNADSRDEWDDMAAFADAQPTDPVRARLREAIEGKGAFRRFRQAVAEHGLADAWQRFSTDRQLARARALLADSGIRVS